MDKTDKLNRFRKFEDAWWYLQDHRLLGDLANVENCLDIMVAKCNPKNHHIEDDDKLNTKVEVWLEFGFPEYKDNKIINFTHDIRLDCGADTFEEAVMELASLVRKYYE